VRQLPPAAWSDLPRARVPARRTSERSDEQQERCRAV